MLKFVNKYQIKLNRQRLLLILFSDFDCVPLSSRNNNERHDERFCESNCTGYNQSEPLAVSFTIFSIILLILIRQIEAKCRTNSVVCCPWCWWVSRVKFKREGFPRKNCYKISPNRVPEWSQDHALRGYCLLFHSTNIHNTFHTYSSRSPRKIFSGSEKEKNIFYNSCVWKKLHKFLAQP